MELSPEQRARIQRLLEAELGRAWLEARAEGVTPSAFAELVDERRRVLRRSGDDPEAAGLPDDPELPGRR